MIEINDFKAFLRKNKKRDSKYNYKFDGNIVTVTTPKILNDETHSLGMYDVVVKRYNLDHWSIVENKLVADYEIMPYSDVL